MKKQSILSSLTAAAVILPALNQASPAVDEQTIQKIDLINSSNRSLPSLSIDPRIQKILDLKVIKIFNMRECADKTNPLIVNSATANNTSSTTTPAASESVVSDGSATAPTASESVVGDASTTASTASESVVGDGSATAPSTSESVVGDGSAATTNSETDAANKTDGEYDPKAIFGTDSKIFTRITKPVQNLFADIMFGQTSVNHNNRRYNLNPFRPDAGIDARTINAYFEIPVTAKMDIKASVGRDAVTSASPIFYTVTGASPGVIAPNTGTTKQAVTGASVKDQRNEGAVSLNYYGEKATTKIEAGASRENDYNSNFVGGNIDFDISSSSTTLSIGSSYTANDIVPNQLGAITPRTGGKNSNWQMLGGITQLINSKSLVQFATTYFSDSGFMNDPYKPDYLPDKKIAWSLAGRYLRYIPSFHEAGLDLNYRYYTDGWGVTSSTFKSLLRVALANGWGLEPGIRYYSQTGTRYYNLLTPDNVTPNSTFVYYTSDYRSASYGQISGQLQIDKQYSASHTIYVGGSYGVRNASLRMGGTKITQPMEQEFTKINISSIYIGIKGVY